MTFQNVYPVVVVGNGPSAILMSYILSGHVPYYDFETYGPIPDMELDQLLRPYSQSPRSLIDATVDVELISYVSINYESFYSSMLPENLLMDLLSAVNESDFISPSTKQSRVKWIHEPDRQVEHLVLGSSPRPGGQWWGRCPDSGQDKSLSYSEMLSFPGYAFNDFFKDHNMQTVPDFYRPTREEVACYYASYVAKVGIDGNFRNGTTVLCVDKNHEQQLVICAAQTSTGVKKTYLANSVILASGVFDKPLRQAKPLSFEEFSNLLIESSTNAILDSFTIIPPLSTPPCEEPCTHGPSSTLVIGSGVSAADVVKSNEPGNSLVHIFKWDSHNNQCPLRNFHHELYPEYHSVYIKMKLAAQDSEQPINQHQECLDSNYEGHPNATILSLSPDGIVDIKLQDGKTISRRVRRIELRTGRSGSVDFLSSDISKIRGPVTKETFRPMVSHQQGESSQFCISKNVFIIGSLCGDTLVRFLLGSCLRVGHDLAGLCGRSWTFDRMSPGRAP